MAAPDDAQLVEAIVGLSRREAHEAALPIAAAVRRVALPAGTRIIIDVPEDDMFSLITTVQFVQHSGGQRYAHSVGVSVAELIERKML